MPRAKVPPEARRRVVQACQQCKTSKRKCNASLPCGHCIKRGMADACHFSDGGNGHQQQPPSPSRNRKASQQSSSLRSDLASANNGFEYPSTAATTADSWQPQLEAPSTGPYSGPTHESIQESSPDTTRAQMLSNNAGEYVFVGKSASLSFLSLVREAVTRCIGPTPFSEHVSSNHMLEIDLESDNGNGQAIDLDHAQQERCMKYYLLGTTGLIDVLRPEETQSFLSKGLDGNSYLTSVKLLVVAIGAQAGALERAHRNANAGDLEKRAFSRARKLVFSGMLEDPNLDMIRALLLLSFYMLGACRRNAAFLYLGIAARAAHTLGLYTLESYAVLDQSRRYVQLKCWKSLVALDLMVTSILGRTTAILAQKNNNDTNMTNISHMDDGSSAEIEAAYRLALLVDSVSGHFNGQDPITVGVAQGYLQNLRDWSGMLPPQLRRSTMPENRTTKTRQSLLGCMHLSCFYYFTVMLVTRPFLIMHVTQQLVGKPDLSQAASANGSNETEELALACIDAAMYMAQTCSDLLELDVLINSMCLLKAWIFAAGLILGFEMFAVRGDRPDLEKAFVACCRVLERLAIKSPQASQYHEILTLFSSAINKHRQLRRSRRLSNAGPLVARIMDLSSQSTFQASETQRASHASNGKPTTIESHNELSMIDPALENTSITLPEGNNDFTTGIDDFPIPSLEEFMFDLHTYGMMPWGPPS